MFDLQLQDASFKGQMFTWCNGRAGEGREKERLDRALVNIEWWQICPKTQITIPVIGSDHSHLVTEIDWKQIRRCKIFRFESMWIKSEDCERMIRNYWREKKVGRLEEAIKVLENCSKALKSWSSQFFPNNKKRIEELKVALAIEPNKDAAEGNQGVETGIINWIINEIEQLWHREEMYWHQRY